MTKAYARGKTRLQQPIRARVFGFLALLRSPKSKDDPPVIKHANKRTDDATRAPPAQATRLGTKERMKKKGRKRGEEGVVVVWEAGYIKYLIINHIDI